MPALTGFGTHCLSVPTAGRCRLAAAEATAEATAEAAAEAAEGSSRRTCYRG